MKYLILVLLLLSAPCGRLLAQPPTAPDSSDVVLDDPDRDESTLWGQPWHFHIYIENDARFFKPNNPTDRFYTNGLALSAAWQPAFVQCFAEHVELLETFDPKRTAFGVNVGQQIFTPRDLADPNLIPDDRPYAGYLYGGVFIQRSNRTTFDHMQLDVGIVGPSSWGEDAQKFIHHMLPDNINPEGWDNQLHDEPAIQLTVRRKWRLSFAGEDSTSDIDIHIIPHVELGLGTVHRYAEAGVMARLGYRLPDDFGPGRLAQIADATGDTPDGWSVCVYAAVAGRAVEHNVFLDGNSFRDSHFVTKEPLVGRLDFGTAIQFKRRRLAVELGYHQTFLTEEFEGQNGDHAYGALTVKVWWLF